MDPCVPGINVANARATARIQLGVPAKYANKMSVDSICKSFRMCKDTNIMPPMDYRKSKRNGKVYLIDPKSPLTCDDFLILLEPSTIEEVQKIAKKLSLVTAGVNKSELKSNCIKILQQLNISEPIEIPLQKVHKVITENLGVINQVPNQDVNKALNNVNLGNHLNNVNLGNHLNNVNLGNRVNNVNLGNKMTPEYGEQPYSPEVAPGYFKLKARPTKIASRQYIPTPSPTPSPSYLTPSPLPIAGRNNSVKKEVINKNEIQKLLTSLNNIQEQVGKPSVEPTTVENENQPTVKN